MAEIRAQCTSCGVVDLSAGEISLHLHPSGGRGAYRFICPRCRTEVDRPASQEIVALLRAVGVEMAHDASPIAAPAPLSLEDRSPDPEAEPFTADDVQAFRYLLENDVAIADSLFREP